MTILWDEAYPAIFIDGDQTFAPAARRDLNKIKEKEIGKRLLSTVSRRTQGIGTTVGKIVTIKYTNDLDDTAQNSVRVMQGLANTEVRKASQPGRVIRTTAGGDSSVIFYAHDREHEYGVATFVVLAHELIHALHVITGDVVKEYSWATDGAIIEAARTVGLGKYAMKPHAFSKPLVENSIRWEWGLPLRTYYGTPGDCDNI